MTKTFDKTLRRVQHGDLTLFQWCISRKHWSLFARASRVISHSADGFFYPLLWLAAWLAGDPRAFPLAATLALAFAVERPLYWVLKNGLKRRRPASAMPGFRSFIMPADEFSFPSGHTSGAFLVATTLALLYPAIAPLSFSWATLVAASRVTLGVHFPTDTAAGAVMGSTLALCAAGWVL